jgi:hypothetical protein
MSEKRGLTGKLHYDFNTAKAVYVKIESGKLVRVTERSFRSYYGERFIYQQVDGEWEYTPYDGPLYFHDTNRKCKNPIGKGKIQYMSSRPWVSQIRPHERHLLDYMYTHD